MADGANLNPGEAPKKATGPLVEPATGPLAPIDETELEPIPPSLPDRKLFLRLAELIIFLVAVIGAVALGLAITGYFTEHAYIGAYLLAYAGFRCADLLVREDYGLDPSHESLTRRLSDQIPVLLLFFAAPFERTYFYGGEAPRWISALALAMELAGLWVALGARIQLGFFSWERRDGVEQRVLVRRGFYRFIRNPAFAGIFLAFIAWPIAYGAPISAILTIVIGTIVIRRTIAREEKELHERYGEEYARYLDESDALIPNLW
jgi:protein-S-isoprenylcysteine O-methyltransferase Ste14